MGAVSLRNVLLVEDNPSDAEVAKFVVEQMGCTVWHYADPIDGLEAAEKQAFDLVLLDWQLPQISGLDFLKRLHRIQGLEKLGVILVSGRNEMKHIKTAIDAGALDYVIKPVDPVILQAKVQRILDKRVDWAQTSVTEDERWKEAEAIIPVEVLSISEVGLDVRGPFKEGQMVDVASPLLREIGIDRVSVRIVGLVKLDGGRTYQQGSFVGLREGELQKIRVYLRNLAVKGGGIMAR